MNLILHELGTEHADQFLAMIADYREHDPDSYTRLFARKREWSPFEFRAFLKECEAQRLDWKPGPNRTSITRYVLLDESGEIFGNGIMRFPLDAKTEKEGGNLSFDVPPSKRGQMYEAHTLNRMLFEAVRAGMARVLVTALSIDTKSIEAIEMNRGEFENEVPSLIWPEKTVRRYWIRFR